MKRLITLLLALAGLAALLGSCGGGEEEPSGADTSYAGYESEVYWIGRELEPPLEAILRSGSYLDRQAIERIIDRLLRTGHGDFRHLLED